MVLKVLKYLLSRYRVISFVISWHSLCLVAPLREVESVAATSLCCISSPSKTQIYKNSQKDGCVDKHVDAFHPHHPTVASSSDSFCYDPSVNYIPMAGETERLSDKLRELGSSRKLVVSSIFRASLLLDADSWESEQRFYEASKIGSTDIRGIVYALNYHKLANGKLCIIIDQALRFLVKKGKRAPLGVWEKKEIRSLRVLLRRMEEVRNKHIDEFVKYEVHIDKWAESKDHYREQRERLINEMGYSVEAVPGLFRAMWSRYLNQFATV
ncbi:hypothetical protein SeMB42_g04228, partial [Synchytrium endobioticum]